MLKFDKRAFFILAFGKPDLERVWTEVYDPISKALGFAPVRSDRRDNGNIVIDQIINDISSGCDIIIADLTYERPNCYFELGYARAVRKNFEVMLCARKDHISHENYSPPIFSFEPPGTVSFSFRRKYCPPKVHFDVAGLDVVCWEENQLPDFATRFRARFEERLGYIREHKEVISNPQGKPVYNVQPDTELEKLRTEEREKVEKK